VRSQSLCGAVAQGSPGAARTRVSAPLSRRLRAVEVSSRSEPERFERLARRRGLVVWPLLLADDDRLLVSLAGEEDRVVRRGATNGLAHRFAAVVDHEVVRSFPLAGADRALLDLVEYLRRLLETPLLLRAH